MGKLKFTNTDATPKVAELEVAPEAVAQIMTWYGAYHAGDRYSVTFNDKRLRKDLNGELIGGVT